MARHPEWFGKLDAIIDTVRHASGLDWLGRSEMRVIFACSERDSIRLLHRFGAEEKDNVLSLPRAALSAQLEAIRDGGRYAAYAGQRREVARQLTAARAEAASRQFLVRRVAPEQPRPALEDLPASIRWRRSAEPGPGRFEIRYRDGIDLMRQLADFLEAAGVHREEFISATDPCHDLRG